MLSQLSTGVADCSSEDKTERKCSILSLPNELLCIVLEAVVFAEPPTGPLDFLTPAPDENTARCNILGFLRLSEVCVRFRVLLLSMSSAWAAVVFKLPVEPSKLALLRSQSQPLSVSLIEPVVESKVLDTIFKHFIAIASENVGRIRSLKMDNGVALFKTPPFANQLLLLDELHLHYDDWKQPFNGLEYSCISAPDLRRAHFSFSSIDGMHDIFNRETGIKFVFPSLQFLKITAEEVDVESPSDLAWIVDLMQASPLIETIHFSSSFFFMEDTATWDTLFMNRDIQLKHLRAFELTGYTPSDMTLYTHICHTRPQRCILDYSPIESDRDETMNGAMQFATSFGHLLEHPAYDGLFLKLTTGVETMPLQVGAFPATNDLLDRREFTQGMSDVVALCLPSAYDGNEILRSHVFDALAAVLKRNKIKQVVLDIPYRYRWPYAVDVILEACSQVTELAVRRLWTFDMTEFVVVPLLKDLLPRLDTLLVEPVLWDPYRRELRDCWDHLVSWLEHRARDDLRISHLHIRGARYLTDGEDAARLKDQIMCVQAAQLVGEFYDERAGHS